LNQPCSAPLLLSELSVAKVEGDHAVEAALQHGQQALHHPLMLRMGKVGVSGGPILEGHAEGMGEAPGQTLLGSVGAAAESGDPRDAIAQLPQLRKDGRDGVRRQVGAEAEQNQVVHHGTGATGRIIDAGLSSRTMVTAVLVAMLVAAGELDPRPLSALPADLQPLVAALKAHGFDVRIALPPRTGAYGQFDPRARILWLSPLTFELGIARQTFLHEAVHAIQSCPSGVVRPLGWTFPLDPAVERGIQAILHLDYPTNREVEREAFGLQGQPDVVPRLLGALRQRCRR